MAEETAIKVTEEPHNIQLEQEVLGSVFLDEKLIKRLAEEVQIMDFYAEQHQHIYRAMLYLHHQNQPINYNTLGDRLKYKEILGEKVTMDYLLGLSDTVASLANFTVWLNELVDLAQKRKIYNLYRKQLETGFRGVNIENVVKQIKSTLDDLSFTTNTETVGISEGIDEWFDNLEKPIPEKDRYYFGFRKLDEKVQLGRSKLAVIAARPGLGKSALALNVVKNLCFQKKKVLFITLEMSLKQVRERLVANLSGVPLQKITDRDVRLDEEEKERIYNAKEKIKKFDWHIYDKGAMTAEKVSNISRKMQREKGLDAVVVDYLQLMTADRKITNRAQEVSQITRGMKVMAQELDIPVIALSQLNRDTAKENAAPSLHHLRESGSIEQDANSVMMLHTEDVDGRYNDNKYVDLYIRKNREGEVGVVNFEFKGSTMEFTEKEHNPLTGGLEPVKQRDLEDEFSDEDTDLPF